MPPQKIHAQQSVHSQIRGQREHKHLDIGNPLRANLQAAQADYRSPSRPVNRSDTFLPQGVGQIHPDFLDNP